MGPRIIRSLIVLGVPGVALGIFYLLLEGFHFEFAALSKEQSFVVVILFISSVVGVILFALHRYASDTKREKSENILSDTVSPGPGHSRATANISIQLMHPLLSMSVRFGVLHVRDGKDQVADRGPLLNKEIYFEDVDDRGTLLATVHYDSVLGLQFKCFVDHRGYTFEVVKQALERNGFTEVTRGEGKALRAWFLLPGYSLCSTVDGHTNNFLYPA